VCSSSDSPFSGQPWYNFLGQLFHGSRQGAIFLGGHFMPEIPLLSLTGKVVLFFAIIGVLAIIPQLGFLRKR
jgi:hypothetical protein